MEDEKGGALIVSAGEWLARVVRAQCGWSSAKFVFVLFVPVFSAVWGKETREPEYDGYSGLGQEKGIYDPRGSHIAG